MKKILLSILTIGLVASIAYVGFSRAFFSDTETSFGNTFQAGEIKLSIDSTQHYNGNVCQKEGDGPYLWVGNSPYPVPGTLCTGTWPLQSLTSEKFFDFADVKPGDYGENTISMHVFNNDAWACIDVSPLIVPTDADKALAAGLNFFAWNDLNCNNIFEPTDEVKLFSNIIGPAFDVLNGKTYTLAAPGLPPITGGTDPELARCIGLSWCAGTLSVNQETGATTCDGTTLGNDAQGGKVIGDISFRVEQSRNNPNFSCTNGQNNGVHELILWRESINENEPWTPLEQKGLLTWTGDGDTFNYTLTAHGLALSTEYSLIYYADPFPGNHPGKLIGTAMSDSSGNLSTSGNPDLQMNLPDPADANNALGAKIWLIPSSAYNSGTNSISWPPDLNTWLFEGNVYIHYHDTSI